MGINVSKLFGTNSLPARIQSAEAGQSENVQARVSNPIQNLGLLNRISAIDCELHPESRTEEKGLGVYYLA